jgi:hypothetical protein
MGHEVDAYFITWKHLHSHLLLESNPWLNLIILNEPSKELALSRLTTLCRVVKIPGTRWKPENNYKQFWSTRVGLEIIADTTIPYDGVILSRPDLDIKIDDIGQWMKPGVYTMPSVCVYKGMNDQFAISDLPTALKVWDTKDMARVSQIYGSSENPEETIYKLATRNGVKLDFKQPLLYALNGEKFI